MVKHAKASLKQKPGAILFFILFLSVGYLLFQNNHEGLTEIASRSTYQNGTPDFYSEKVEPLLSNRCVACHGCYQSPCQVNFQSYEGLRRGIHAHNVYEATRATEAAPTRLGVDGHGVPKWRELGFKSILNTQRERSILLEAIETTQGEAEALGKPTEQRVCPTTISEYKEARSAGEVLSMPYGLPKLQSEEKQILITWTNAGAPGPSKETLEKRTLEENKSRESVKAWELYLNEEGQKQKLVSRYLFEHLFLANLYFPENPKVNFRLIRSKTSCEAPSDLATRRPNDDPGVEDFYYCLVPSRLAIVDKTYLPYALSPEKLQWVRTLFSSEKWDVTKKNEYSAATSSNPFIVFADIPVNIRYRFLLEDSQYHIMTFIKGPVCEGSNAVNSISDHFFVYFLRPESDLMVKRPEFEKNVSPFLALPGEVGSSLTGPGEVTEFLANMIGRKRNVYREKRFEEFKKQFPRGYSYRDIWDGDGVNSNAILTVIRNNESATVLKGPVGDVAKNYFVLDYALIERLVYNLVVNFDVYGNFSHQAASRLYMALLRMEAEENFLAMMPSNQREEIYKNWYQGFFATTKNYWLYYHGVDPEFPVDIVYKTADPVLEFSKHVLFEKFNERVRGNADELNWKKLSGSKTGQKTHFQKFQESQFRWPPMSIISPI